MEITPHPNSDKNSDHLLAGDALEDARDAFPWITILYWIDLLFLPHLGLLNLLRGGHALV